jgi:hypothetical protein
MYAQAKQKYEATTPIRGDKDKKRPLGNRRDKHMHIREKIADDVVTYECCCYDGDYGTVVVYYPDDTVGIKLGKYNTSYVREFLVELLGDLFVYTKNSKTVLQLKDGTDKYVLGGNELKLKLSRSKGSLKTVWTVEQAEGSLEWRLNKAEANKVRAQYTDFLKYYKGMIQLLTEPVDFEVKYANRRWNRPTADTPFVARSEVAIHMETLVNMFGQTTHIHGGNPALNMQEVKKAMYTHKIRYGKPEEEEQYNLKVKAGQLEVLALMRNNQPEETKGDNFYRAFLTLLVAQQSYVPTKPEFFTLSKASVEKKADEFVLRVHKEQVLEQVRMPVGRVASTNYVHWLQFV